jgi:hypothetical protein
MSGPIPCPSCGQPVPPGRLACPSCGALVASVARVEPIAATGDDDDLAGVPPDAEPEPAAAEGSAVPEPGWPQEGAAAIEAPPGAPPPAAMERPVDDAPEAEDIVPGGTVPGSYLPPTPLQRAGADPPGGAYAPPPPAAPATWPPPAPPATWPPPAPPAPPAATGGWIPPTPGPVGSTPAGVPPAASSVGTGAPGGPPRDAREAVPGRASILADLPFDAPDQLEGWLIALGGGLGIIGFFLPWTASLGTGLEGYFGSWGLGIVSHLPVFAFLVIVTALAVLPNRVATWVRSGVCGMVGGGLLFGIVWLYLGSDASQLGALLSAVAAILLIAGGVIAVAPGRTAHRGEDAQT